MSFKKITELFDFSLAFECPKKKEKVVITDPKVLSVAGHCADHGPDWTYPADHWIEFDCPLCAGVHKFEVRE